MEERTNLQEGITRITVAGFKSIAEEQSIDIRPLTLLAGANSSGKSSIMQPLLLLKQTLEASYDPGPLLLHGPNAKFTSAAQPLSRAKGHPGSVFRIEIAVGAKVVALQFNHQADRGLEIDQMVFADGQERISLRPGMTYDEAVSAVPSHIKDAIRTLPSLLGKVFKDAKIDTQWPGEQSKWVVVRDRCFLELALDTKTGDHRLFSPGEYVEPHVRYLIHLPGLRGNPERAYPVTAVGSTFPGTFEKYTASVIAQWQMDGDLDRLEMLAQDLNMLGLNWTAVARRINDTQVELQVGQLARRTEGKVRDLVNIADVGFGVSQTLPVLVALHSAAPGQLVYLEQPEIHLHPRAQVAMAQVLANAAQRGVRVVAETHSALLLLGVQTLVAEGKLPPELVKLHWFTQREDGATEISSRDLDETGAFGDWPQDFGLVELEAESRYLDAVDSHYRGS